jgi:hypothetical protein
MLALLRWDIIRKIFCFYYLNNMIHRRNHKDILGGVPEVPNSILDYVSAASYSRQLVPEIVEINVENL